MRRIQYKQNALLLSGMIIFFTAITPAQMASQKFDERLIFRGVTGVTVGGGYQTWKLSGKGTISQISAPIIAAVPLTSRLLMTLSNSPGSSSIEKQRLQGIADTRVSLSYVMPGESVWLNGGVSVPTGITKLNEDQLSVAAIIAQTALNYRVPVFGQGLNGNAGFAYAYSMTRRLIIGTGATFLYKGKFQPAVANGISSTFDPGDEISANVGFDWSAASKNSRFSSDVTLTNYLPEKVDGEKFLQSGIRFMTMTAYSVKFGKSTHVFQLRSRIRTQSELFTGGSSTKYKSSQHYEFQYSPSWLLSPKLLLGGSLELKNYTGDQLPLGGTIYETGKALIGVIGLENALTLSQSIRVTSGIKYGLGSITIDNLKYNVNGIDLSMAIRVSF